jgi:hypothetical protein
MQSDLTVTVMEEGFFFFFFLGGGGSTGFGLRVSHLLGR